MIREQARDLRGVLLRLAALVRLPAERIDAVLVEARLRRAFVPLLVREDLTWDEVAASPCIRRNCRAWSSIPACCAPIRTARPWPTSSAMSAPSNPAEQAEDPDPLLQLPEFRIGKSGIERSYDLTLRGRAGLSRVEVNAIGREIRELDRREGVPGADLRLSARSRAAAVLRRAALGRARRPAPSSSTRARAG